MLSPEHVLSRTSGERLLLLPLSEKRRLRALEIGAALLACAEAELGRTRDRLEAAFAAVEVTPSERRLASGLTKLIEDACIFQELDSLDSARIRSQVFARAAARRREASPLAPFFRAEVLEESARTLDMTEAGLEEALYADLRGNHRLLETPAFDARALVARYEQAQVQAVLLRAVEVLARVKCREPETYRQLFRKLKFRRLLYHLEKLPSGDYSIQIDGPYSLFEAVTKYGLELALLVPALEACDVLELSAKVLWGKSRTPLRFEYRHVSPSSAGGGGESLRDDVKDLLEQFQALETPWQVALAEEILELPGVGTCVPDLVFRHPRSDVPIHLEVLGYWSRDAVFRRVELVEQGLGRPVLFVAGARLRVSEELLEGEELAGLYIHRGKPSARAVERKLNAIHERIVG